MERSARTRYRVAVVGLLVVIISMTAGFAISSAVVTNSDGSINACYSPKVGKLRASIIGCKAKETAIRLGGPNQLPMSYADMPSDGALTINGNVDVATLSIPPGTYVVNASVNLANQSSSSRAWTNCDLFDGVNFRSFGSEGSAALDTSAAFLDRFESVALTGRVTLATFGPITLRCQIIATNGFPTDVALRSPTLIAVKVKT